MICWNKKLKVLRCYICVVSWVVLLLLYLSYWRTESSSSVHPPVPAGKELSVRGQDAEAMAAQDKPRLKKLRQLCNKPDRILAATEGRLSNSQYELIGIIVNTRHGDRGPLQPVRNLSNINCGHKSYYGSAYKHFVASILNISKTTDYTNFAGSFSKYPVLPSHYRCDVAHLTPQGVVQHLKLGNVLNDVYINQLDLFSHPWESDDIVVHSTKFRRTFQSALAFLYGFLPKFDLSQLRMQEGRGISFCSKNCRCDRVSILDEKHEQEKKMLRKSHPGVVELIEKLSALVKDGANAPDIVNPMGMRDALMAYTCHGHKLPCMDGVCVQNEDVSSIISYVEWENKQKKSRAKHRSSKLKAYGLMKDIVRNMDTMMRDGKPKMVLYSGHDKTLTYILNSLGVPVYQLPYYASRIIFEVYRNNSNKIKNGQYRLNYFFRVVYNGKDISKFLSFCDVKTVAHYTGGNGIRNSISLCPVNDLDNFIRADGYFAEYNSSNFREACAITATTTVKVPLSDVH